MVRITHFTKLVLLPLLAAGGLLALVSLNPATVRAEPTMAAYDPSRITVEMFLERDRKKDLQAIEEAFGTVSISKVRAQFFRLGHPPENIAFGRNVPADVARLAIRLAQTYNDGIQYILAEIRFPPDYIAIGTSAFDEASQIPISPEDLARLNDPSLSTAEFHALYRELTGEAKLQLLSPDY